MKVLIIGGGGYVGRIINQAIEAVHEVTHLDLKPVPGAEDRTIVGSISDDATVTKATQGQDAVLFAALGTAAGGPKATCETIDPAFNVNLRDQYRVLKFALQQGVRHFISLSTMDVYGGVKLDHLLTEDNTTPKAFRNPYGISKRLAEQLYVVGSQKYPDATMLVLRLNLPSNEHDFNLPENKYDPTAGWLNFCATGPNDTARLMLAALNCKTPGCHILQTSGDLLNIRFPNTKVTALLGWAPQGN